MKRRGRASGSTRKAVLPKARKASMVRSTTHVQKQLDDALRERDEALEQVSATSEILKIISKAPGDLEPVFDAMLENATRFCDARFATLYLCDGDTWRAVAATRDAPPGYVEARKRNLLQLSPGGPLDQLVGTKQVVHIADLKELRPYRERHPTIVTAVDLGGFRTCLMVPILRDDELVGAVSILRQEVRPFTDKQINLLENFAAQAVIAIDNARLLNELRQRTDDLSESLEQQTATSDVLSVISSSPGELEPVFNTMLANAVRICEAKFGTMLRAEEGGYRVVAMHGPPPAYAAERRRNPVLRVGPTNPLARVAASRQLLHITDVRLDQAYLDRDPAFLVLADDAGARTLFMVPMLKEDKLIGAIAIYRQEVRRFTEKQVELVKNFAAQAVIAIENARLLNELRQRTDDLTESLEQQTATSEILEVISNSPTDTQPAFDAIVRSGLRLFPDAVVAISLPDRDLVKLAAISGADEAGLEALRGRYPMPLSHEFITGTAILDRREIDLADAREPPKELTVGAQNLLAGGYCAMTVMPMMRGDETIGALNVIRRYPGPLSDKQRELLRTFANQAVIAIENTRLFSELRESLQQQTATADVLKVISRSTFDLQAVFKALVDSAAQLCRAKMANIALLKEDGFEYHAAYGFEPDYMAYVRSHNLKADRGSVMGRAVLEARIVHIHDVLVDSEYATGAGNRWRLDAQKRGGFRTALGVPLLREGKPVGAMFLSRDTVEPFTQQQIDLITTFATQAIIAIENTRLLNELRQRTDDLSKSLEDLRTTQDRLVQTQKLALLGQLTAGIAHEIKNPLNFVNNFSGISAELIDELQDTLKEIPLDDRARTEINELTDTLKSNFDKVVHHGGRADAIVKNMLQHSREGSGEHRVIDINALVEESLNLAWHGARAETQGFEIKLKQFFDGSAGGADIFPQDIRRALLNVISNGFYAATKRRAETNGGDYEPTLTASTKNLGDRVEIRIRDNGTGMTSDVKEKMFNPFFTTKPTGEGTGLGLSISHDIIVKQHGGSIEVDTQPGEFTEVRVILPRVAVFV